MKPTKEPKPGPRAKSSVAEVALRVEEVLRIRLDGAQYHDVVQYAAEKGWGLKERQVATYIRRADDLLVERQDKSRKRAIARHLARREALFARCVNAADYRTALAVLTDLAKLQGLYPDSRELKELLRLAAARSHCKVVCFDLGPCDGLVFEGSANLRTNGNREQLTATRDRALHDWHAAWIDELVSAHGQDEQAR